MRFSVIVPVYNVEKYLSKCLDSVLQQEFLDFEIIAVNDGSTDNSLQILNKYKCKDDRIKIVDQENKGLGGARNTGICNAQGEYLVFLDSDDYIDKKMLIDLNEIIIKYDLDIIAFDCLRVDNGGNVIEQITVKNYADDFTLLTPKRFFCFEPTSCTKIYKRSLFVENGIMFPEHLWYEDFATIFKLIPFTRKIGYFKKPYYYYVQQPQSITHSSNTKRMMEIITAFDSNLRFYREKNLFEEFYDELEWNCVLHVLYYSAFRLFCCGFNIRKMNYLYKYCSDLFPRYKENRYVSANKDKLDMFNLILDHKCFRFYLKTGFMIKYSSLLIKFKKIFKVKK